MKSISSLLLVVFSLMYVGCASTSQQREPNQVSTDFGKDMIVMKQSVTCYVDRNDDNTMLLDTAYNSDGITTGVTIYNFLNTSEKMRFDDVSISFSNKNELILAATDKNGSVVTLSLDIDRKGSDHKGVLIVRNSQKKLQHESVEYKIK